MKFLDQSIEEILHLLATNRLFDTKERMPVAIEYPASLVTSFSKCSIRRCLKEVSLLRWFERRSVGLSSAISLPLKGARKASL